MNDSTSGRPVTRRIRAPLTGPLVILAGVALLTAGCSGGSANSPAPGTSMATAPASSLTSSAAAPAPSAAASSGTYAAAAGSNTYQKAVAYAQCMREHGVPNFPDPLPNGGFTLGPHVTGGTNGQVSPRYQAAENACASLNPVGILSPQQQQHALNQLLKLSACMRSHGLKNFPDPTFGSSGVELHIIGFNRNSPQFQNAWHACLAQIGAGGGQR